MVGLGFHPAPKPSDPPRRRLPLPLRLPSTPTRPDPLFQVAGFTARFSAGAGLRFASVKGAGHMVPQSKPPLALHLMRSFVYDEEL